MRRNSSIVVPELGRLLSRWAQEYKDRYRRYLRRSFTVPNPSGYNLDSVQQDLDTSYHLKDCYAFTGAAAASQAAPFVDVDTIDLYVSDDARAEILRNPDSRPRVGPDLRVIHGFDAGVFLNSHRLSNQVPVVSDIQAYLDLFARGGRDLKQANYLRETRIEPLWRDR